MDPDLPTRAFEMALFRGRLGKFLWLNFQIVAYALRPLFIKRQPITAWLGINILFQLLFGVLFWQAFGGASLAYLLGSVLVAGGLGLHPLSAHFLSEHYLIPDASRDETFDYHGPLNILTFSVGYHRAHHDLSNVPGSRLPQVVAMAPEFYPSYAVHKKWATLPLRFVFDDAITLASRVRRQPP